MVLWRHSQTTYACLSGTNAVDTPRATFAPLLFIINTYPQRPVYNHKNKLLDTNPVDPPRVNFAPLLFMINTYPHRPACNHNNNSNFYDEVTSPVALLFGATPHLVHTTFYYSILTKKKSPFCGNFLSFCDNHLLILPSHPPKKPLLPHFFP